MDQDLLIKAINAAKGGQRYAFATVIEATLKGTPRKSGAKMLVLEDGTIYGTIGGGRNEKAAQKKCLEAIKTGKPETVTYDYFGRVGQSVCGGQIKVFIEPFAAQRQLIICGGGHIGLQLSAIGKLLNYKITVIDSRRAYANKRRFPHADKLLVGDHAKQLKKTKITPHTDIMIVTHGNEHDFLCLKEVITSKAGYIGVISSKAKRVKFFKRLKAMGYSQKHLEKIRIPAGMDIGAQSPAEIAVSIASELVQEANQKFLKTDKFKEKDKNS